VLSQEFKFHPMAVENCRTRNHIPRVHVYPDHLFLVIHAPEIGTGGHVHYLELDQFIGEHFLVTVHGPLNPKVPLAAALRETTSVQERLERGRLRLTSPFGLTYAVVSAIARREAELTGDIARQVGLLEQRVMSASDEEPQEFLTELFTARHELLTIRTMAAQGGEIYRRAIRVTKFAQRDSIKLMKDLLDQYERVESLSQAQLNFLMGVTEFYRARTDTKMTIAAERLAVIAAVTLPITATSSIVGMNVIVNEQTHWLWLGILLGFMALMSGVLLRWAKRQGWW
jgi:magnesium transporter